MKKAIFTLLCLLPAFTCQARTIIVDANGSGEYPTIQDAIDDSNNGDVVILTPGTYTGLGNRDIDFNGLAITLRSTDPNDPNIVVATIIDCNGTITEPHRGFYFHTGENANSILSGFTIKNGYAWRGGGIYCWWDSSPTITNCTISGNSAELGGGIFYLCLYGSPTITNCTISGNSAELSGGIFYWCLYGSPTITNCTITGNTAGGGGGITCFGDSPVITNCILWDNVASSDSQLFSLAVPTYCCIQDWTGGGPGNIDIDPCFVAPGCWADANDPNIIVEPNDPNAIWIEGDYHLYPFSLCINAGDPNYLPEPNETDLDGSPRIIAGRIDMGAYESNHTRARLWIFPRLIYRYSQRQRRILAWLRLPKGVTRDDIDSNTPLLLYPGEIEPTRQYIFQHGRRGPKRVSIIAYFDKRDLMDVISNKGRAELKLVGRLKTGQYFFGRDTIRIITRRPPPRRPRHRR